MKQEDSSLHSLELQLSSLTEITIFSGFINLEVMWYSLTRQVPFTSAV